MPAGQVERDWSVPYVASEGVEQAWLVVYRDPEAHWDLYQLGEELTDLEDMFRLWRFRHVTTVERVIGFKRGTGGHRRRQLPEEDARRRAVPRDLEAADRSLIRLLLGDGRSFRATVERGRRPVHAFSGPRSRSTTELLSRFLIKTQPLGPTARATANGPCARMPEPPAQ